MDCVSRTPSVNVACCSSDISSPDGVVPSPGASISMKCRRKVKFSAVLPEAVIPCQGSSGSAGYDFCSAEDGLIPPWGSEVFDTGVMVSRVPKSAFLKLESRSGLALKNNIFVQAGIIDRDFKSSVKVLLFNFSSSPFTVSKGQRICQGIFYKTLGAKRIQKVSAIRKERGKEGFGSTD